MNILFRYTPDNGTTRRARRLSFVHVFDIHARRAMTPCDHPHAKNRAVLRFVARFNGERCLSFPCNAAGHVEMDGLSKDELNDYLFARALRGRDYASPVVERVGS
jgi:hypothetical protein